MRTGNRSLELPDSTRPENLEPRGHEPCNTVPSGQASSLTPRVLSAGIDSLYWSSACGIDEDRFAWLWTARRRAAQRTEVIELNGHSLRVEPRGSGHYPLLLKCAEFSVQLTDSVQVPTAYVQVRSGFLHDKGGPRAAYESSAVVVAALCGHRIGPAKASRLDVYADFAGWVLTDADRRGLVAKAKLHSVLRAASDEYETLRVGTSPMVVRLYRKDIEVRSKAGFADLFWGGYLGPVVRVEAQALNAKLRQVGIVSVDDALSSFGNLWHRATTAFCVLREPGTGSPETWPVRPEWRAVQALAFGAFPQSDRVPFVQLERDTMRVVRVLLGSLSSWAASEGVFDPGEALVRLREQYPELVTRRGGSFADEVVRKHTALARAVRQARYA